MATRSGTLTTANQTTEGRAVRDVSPVINLLEPESYPLTVILTKAKDRAKVTGNQKFEWIEDALLPRYDTLAADLTAAATTMTVSNYSYFVKNMLVRINKSEIVRVTATPSSSSVSISRAVGETSASAAVNGNQLHIIGMAFEEGAAIGDILSNVKEYPYNYCQIFRTPFGWTGSAQNSEVYGEPDKSYDRAVKIIEHLKDIENALIMGERYSTSSGGVDSKQLRTTRGLLRFISTNSQDAGGTLTESEFDEFLRKAFRYGNKKKLGIFSSKLSVVVNALAKARIRLKPADKVYGLALTEYLVSGGKTLEFVDHPLFENDSLSDLTGLAGTGIVVDVVDLKLRYMKNRYLSHRLDLVQDGSDTEKEEILSECGLELQQEKKHAELTGVTD